MLKMISESDSDIESATDSDSDWMEEQASKDSKGPGKKRKKLTRRISSPPHPSKQNNSLSSPAFISGPLSINKGLEEKIKTESLLPVVCGNKKGILHKDKFNNSEPCIECKDQFLTPTEFEKFGGREKNKKWKTSIYCYQVQIQTLIQKGFLSSPSFKSKRSQDHEEESPKTRPVARKSRTELQRNDYSGRKPPQTHKHVKRDSIRNGHSSEFLSTSESGSEQNDSTSDKEVVDNRLNVAQFQDTFPVSCVKGRGTLHVKRFAKATHGRCIRTPAAWLTPQGFIDMNKPNGNWRRDIIARTVPLGRLIMERLLILHTVNCKCPICTGDHLHLLDQNNDDECFECGSDEDLVCCSKCPRVFHQQCHKPVIQDEALRNKWSCSYCIKQIKRSR